jgi:Glycosyltransferase family 87
LTLGSYILAVVLLAAFAVAPALAVCELQRRLLPRLDRATAALARVVGWLCVVVVLGELLGSVGLFRAWALVLGSLLVGIALWLVARRCPLPAPGPPEAPAPPLSRVEACVAGVAALLVLAVWAVPARISLAHGMRAPDTLWYHGPFAARFVQDGWVTHLHFVELDPLTAFYAANSELLHAIGIALFDSHDVLSPLVNLGMVALALLAGWCIGRPCGRQPLTLIAVAIALSLPILWGVNAGQAANDVAGLAFLLAAAALLVNGAPTLRGGAAGLALGTKLSLAGPALAVTLVRPRWRALVAFALTGGYWYLRNLVATGWVLPTEPRPLTEHLEFSMSHYLLDGRIWDRYFFPGLKFGFGSVWPVVVGLAAAGSVGAVAIRGDRTRRLLGAAAVACAVLYAVTPNSAAGREGDPWSFGLNLRYATPAVALGLALLPLWAPARWRRPLAAVLFAALVVTLLSPTGLWSGRRLEALAYGAALAAVVFALVRFRWLRPVVAAALLAAGFFVQRHYLEHRYAGFLQALGLPSEMAHTRIGVLGITTSYPLYGGDLSNRVIYIGRHGPHGSFTREPSCAAWRRAVNAGRFRYLVIAPVTSPDLPAQAPKAPPIEATWTDAVPLRRIGRLTTIYRIDRPLDPAGCP